MITNATALRPLEQEDKRAGPSRTPTPAGKDTTRRLVCTRTAEPELAADRLDHLYIILVILQRRLKEILSADHTDRLACGKLRHNLDGRPLSEQERVFR